MLWQFKHRGYKPDRLALEESLFSLGNGYLGVRGCLEEQPDIQGSIRGTYINGLYARVPMQHAEMAYGFPLEQDKQPRIIDTQTTRIRLDDEWLELSEDNVSDYHVWLEFDCGISVRSYTYKTQNGKTANLKFERMASLVQPELFYYRISVQYEGTICMNSYVDTNVENYVNPNDPRVGSGHGRLMGLDHIAAEGELVEAMMRVTSTGILQGTATYYYAMSDRGRIYGKNRLEDRQAVYSVAAVGELVLEKRCAFTDSLRFDNCLEHAIRLPQKYSFASLLELQKKHLDGYWDAYKIDILGCEQDQLALRFMQFQLLQALGRDAHANMAAKGLSGEGYEGHYFWDTEVYAIPVVMWSLPERAKALLTYRHRLLPMAKQRAKELGHLRGAAYPWRTISGIESSGYFPAGTAQYHLNADIAYAAIQYHLVHQDWSFVQSVLFELIFETALIWLEVGHIDGDAFKICAVTGPDEYTAIVNNNYYTNAMAKYHLYWVVKLYQQLVSRFGSEFEAIWSKRCTQQMIEDFEWASDHMYLPVDAQRKIVLQDEAFLGKPIWPFEHPEFSKRPLLLHYHPLTIYRYQVLKQADSVLANLLLEDYTTDEYMENSYNYYEKITTHDSSLSPCIYGMMAARLGRINEAYRFFQDSLSLDLRDTHGNTKDGLHLANIAGGVLSLYKGFAGLRITEKGIAFRPICPGAWRGYAFGLHVYGGHLWFEMIREGGVERVKFQWHPDKITPQAPIELLLHFDDKTQYLTVAAGASVSLERVQGNQGIAMAGRHFSGVAFDMDGVLTETSHWHYVAWCDLATRLGFELPSEIEDQVRGVSRMASLDIVLAQGGAAHQNYTQAEKIEMATWKNERYLEYISTFTAQERMPGVEDLLMALSARGVKIALASASVNAPQLLKAMGIEGYFDAIVDPKTISKGKPAPDIFQAAAKALGLAPEECIGVEDAQAGVESILSAGLYPVGISKTPLEGAKENYLDILSFNQALGLDHQS